MKKWILAFIMLFSLVACDQIEQIYDVSISADDIILAVYSEEPDWESYITIEGIDLSFVTDSLIVDATKVNLNELGEYVVSFSYNISEHEIATGSFKVTVSDLIGPVINLEGDDEIYIYVNQSFDDPGYSIIDNFDLSIINENISINSNLDITTPGTYLITYQAIDISGNSSELVTRTIHVLSNDAPQLNLIGSDDITIEVGSIYEELGISIIDDHDLDLVFQIVGEVNTSVIDDYQLEYVVVDSQGNQTTINRMVHVVDTEAPIITLLGDTSVIIYETEEFVDPGYEISDNYDILFNVEQISVHSNLILNTPGNYLITYQVTDSSGNQSVLISREITILSDQLPTITLLGLHEMTVEYDSEFIEPGYFVTDDRDDYLLFLDGSVDTKVLGDYILRYEILDSQGNRFVVERLVHVVDTTYPMIFLVGDKDYVMYVGETYIEPGIVAYDNYDGDYELEDISITSNLNSETPGSYYIIYYVTDSNGNYSETLVRNIEVLEDFAPVITLNGESEIYLDIGTPYVEDGASAFDERDGITEVNITGSVDHNTLGTYPITYSSVDNYGHITEIIRYVYVVDTVSPVITLNGDEIITTYLGDYYEDQSATVSDNCDQDIKVMTYSTYNPFIVGLYQIHYVAIDNSGNQASITRQVHVKPIETYLNDRGVIITDSINYIVDVFEIDDTYLLVGQTTSDGIIQCVDEFGQEIWSQYITQEEYADIIINYSSISDFDEILIAGTKHGISGRYGFYAIYDLVGNLIHYEESNPIENLGYNGIKHLSNGNYLIVIDESHTTTSMKMLDSDFQEVWNINVPSQLQFKELYENEDTTYTLYASSYGMLIIYNLNSDGSIINTQTIGVGNYVRQMYFDDNKIVLATQGGLAVYTDHVSHYLYNYEGIPIELWGITKTSEVSYVAVGHYLKTTRKESILIQLDENFNAISYLEIKGSNDDQLDKVFALSNGLIIAAGWTLSMDDDFENNTHVNGIGFIYVNPYDFSQITEVDHNKPIIELNSYNTVNIEVGSVYLEEGATIIDEDPNAQLFIYGQVDTSKPGLYELYYQAIDNAGNKTLTRRTVHVYEELDDEVEYVIDLYALLGNDDILYNSIFVFDYNFDHLLSKQEIAGITNLTIAHEKLTNLKYVSLLENLEELTILNTGLIDIDGVQNLTNLIYLNLSHNDIIELPDFSSLDQLIQLNLAVNLINDVSNINDMTSLEFLEISENPISNIDGLGSLPNVTAIYAEYIKSISFTTISEYQMLKYINLNWGVLEFVTGFDNPNLEHISIFNNKLSTLNGFSGLVNSPNLLQLDLGQNQINDLSGIAGLSQLEELYLSNNNIVDISPLAGLTNLKHLSIINNSIIDLSALSSLQNLTSLNLGDAGIDYSVLAVLPLLNYVNIWFNNQEITINSINRQVFEYLLDQNVEVVNSYIIWFYFIDQNLASVLETYDLDYSNSIDLYESRNIKNLDLSNIDVYNLNGLNKLYSLETLIISTEFLDLSVGSNDSIILNDLITHGVSITYI